MLYVIYTYTMNIYSTDILDTAHKINQEIDLDNWYGIDVIKKVNNSHLKKKTMNKTLKFGYHQIGNYIIGKLNCNLLTSSCIQLKNEFLKEFDYQENLGKYGMTRVEVVFPIFTASADYAKNWCQFDLFKKKLELAMLDYKADQIVQRKKYVLRIEDTGLNKKEKNKKYDELIKSDKKILEDLPF